jgi:hypothetical protein
MNAFFWVRALFFVTLRFFLLLGIGLFYENFEVSPLPAWTLTVFVYFLLFLTTFLCARWVYGKLLPTSRTLLVVLALFLVLQTLCEAILYISITNATFRSVVTGYSLMSLLLLTWHGIAVVLAYYQKRRHILRAVAPEGLQI